MAVHSLVEKRPSPGSLAGYPNSGSRKKFAPAHDNDPLRGTTRDAGIELFEDESAVDGPPSAPSSAKLWISGLFGALVGSSACLGLWVSGLEPPASWRIAGSLLTALPQARAADVEPSDPVRGTLSQVPKPTTDAKPPALGEAEEELLADTRRLHRLLEKRATELESAQENARQARRMAGEAAVRTGLLEKELQNAKTNLSLTHAKLQETLARATPPPQIERVVHLPALIPAPRQPEQAFLRYTKGLHLYQAGRYVEAESEFLAAIAADDQDARYHYYAGLCRLELGKKEPALEGFRTGAKLEKENKPSRVFVILALEAASKERLELLRSFRP
jgi:TolA-binding protein